MSTHDEVLTDYNRSWALLTIGVTLTVSSMGYLWFGVVGIALTGIVFILLSFIARFES